MKSIGKVVYDLKHYKDNVYNVLKNFSKKDQLTIMKLVLFDSTNYCYNNLDLLIEVYQNNQGQTYGNFI